MSCMMHKVVLEHYKGQHIVSDHRVYTSVYIVEVLFLRPETLNLIIISFNFVSVYVIVM